MLKLLFLHDYLLLFLNILRIDCRRWYLHVLEFVIRIIITIVEISFWNTSRLQKLMEMRRLSLITIRISWFYLCSWYLRIYLIAVVVALEKRNKRGSTFLLLPFSRFFDFSYVLRSSSKNISIPLVMMLLVAARVVWEKLIFNTIALVVVVFDDLITWWRLICTLWI